MSSAISFLLGNQLTSIDFENDTRFTPTTTLLNYLRSLPDRKGTKEGCAEGDCGACTIVLAELDRSGELSYKAIDSCLVFLPMIHGKQIITVEDLKEPDGTLHPVQKALVEVNGSQCGFCTPGIVMSLFALYKDYNNPSPADIKEFLAGNLCRCTGYQPILEAALKACEQTRKDHFSDRASHIKSVLLKIKQTSFTYQTTSQKYWRPVLLTEALRLRKQFPQALLVNGGTDLALRVTKNHQRLTEIIDLSNIAALKEIKSTKSKVNFGAGTCLQDVKTYSNKHLPALYDMLSTFGSIQIRNLATFGGNLASASPIGDSAPLLMAYDAKVVLRSPAGSRSIRISEFITGYRKTNCRVDEIITGIEVPFPQAGSRIRFYKFSKRKDLDIATVSAGFHLMLNNNGIVQKAILAFGGLAEMTKRAKLVEKNLIDKLWRRSTVEECFPLLHQSFTPISDARASAEGRILAAQNLLLKFWSDTSEETQNE